MINIIGTISSRVINQVPNIVSELTYSVSNTDYGSATYVYHGGLVSDGTFFIRRFLKSDPAINGIVISNLDQWTDRTTLNYA